MTSPRAIQYDTTYHIYNRGTNRENIFFQDRNYAHFMNLYAKYLGPITDTYAYCLLKNHFHLLLRTKSKEELTGSVAWVIEDSLPGKQFSNFFNAYAKAINRLYGRTGSLFEHPFRRIQITHDCQFWNVVAYIHQNPQKHNFVDDFREWKWSSFDVLQSTKPTLLKRDIVLEWLGGVESFAERHAHLITDAEAANFSNEDLD